MANLTRYTGGTASDDGVTIGSWLGTTVQYNRIKLVSDPEDLVNYDPSSSDFYPNYAHTIFLTTD